MTTHTKRTSLPREAEVKKFLEKIVINAGVGRAGQNAQFEDKVLPQIEKDIAAMTGQKPQVRRAYKSISGFKLREGQIVGVRVTLRGRNMVDFFERFIRIVLPRVRDFSGLAVSSVDGGGVLNVGLKEQYVFTEIMPETSPFSFSLGLSIVPKDKNRDRSMEQYRHFGVPLKKS